MFSRRQFIKYSSSLALLPMVPSSATNVMAQVPKPPPDRFFVMIRVQGGAGGMDVTLGLDPWTDAVVPDPTDMFLEYLPQNLTAITPQIKVGPAADILKNHAGDFSIVNGVFMSQVDNGHPASLNYITSGSTMSSSPALPVEIARATNEGDFGVLFNNGLTMGDRAVSSSSLGDLGDLSHRTDLNSILQQLIRNGGSGSYYDALKKVLASEASVEVFSKNLATFGAKPSESDVLVAAFMSNVSSAAQFDMNGYNLDTHSGHAGNHLTQQTKAWTDISALFTLFKKTPYGTAGESLFDRTTFLVVSEFARTPALNSSGGKDHNPLTNSVLLAGRGVNGGIVVGASRLVTAKESATGASYHIAYPIDYSTFEVQRTRTPQAQMIFPENVAQTVAVIMGADRTIFRSVPAETLPLSPLIKV